MGASLQSASMPRTRLDIAVVENGLLPTRARAQAAILAGMVRVDGVKVEKPSHQVEAEAAIELAERPPFVSRGGEKLAGALDDFGIDVTDCDVLDLGASTGGFTDCVLKRGARSVIAVDVGYGQLDWALRNDPRVTVLERTNARHLTPDDLPRRPDLVVCDVAFISVATIWPSVVPLMADAFRAVVLVKPQFEVGRSRVGSGGVVRDPEAHRDAIIQVARAIDHGAAVIRGIAPSHLRGPKGNREFFIHADSGMSGSEGVDIASAATTACEVES